MTTVSDFLRGLFYIVLLVVLVVVLRRYFVVRPDAGRVLRIVYRGLTWVVLPLGASLGIFYALGGSLITLFALALMAPFQLVAIQAFTAAGVCAYLSVYNLWAYTQDKNHPDAPEKSRRIGIYFMLASLSLSVGIAYWSIAEMIARALMGG